MDKEQKLEDILKNIVKQFGKQILDKSSSTQLEGILSDYLAHDKGMLKLFRRAINENIAHELLQCDALGKSEQKIKVQTLKVKFKEDNFLEESVAYQVVDCFAYALGWTRSVAQQKTQSEAEKTKPVSTEGTKVKPPTKKSDAKNTPIEKSPVKNQRTQYQNQSKSTSKTEQQEQPYFRQKKKSGGFFSWFDTMCTTICSVICTLSLVSILDMDLSKFWTKLFYWSCVVLLVVLAECFPKIKKFLWIGAIICAIAFMVL